MSKLDTASDIVCLLTPRSLDRPWLLYEAGVAKGKLNTPVYGIALGIPLNRAATGPFAQFQNCDDSEENITKLVMQLVRRIPGSEPDQDAIEMQVRTFRERANAALKKLADTKSMPEKEQTAETSVAKLFEEVKVMFQDLPSRIDSRLTERPFRNRRLRPLHPMMMHELIHVATRGANDPMALLLVASFFRDDAPWIYEIIVEMYRTAKSGNLRALDGQIKILRHAIDFTMHGPFMEEFGASKEMNIALRDLMMLTDDVVSRFRKEIPKAIIAKDGSKVVD